MPTSHVHRLLIFCTAARQPTLNAWLQANIDAGAAWLDVPLNASGLPTDPPVAWACSTALTLPDGVEIAQQLLMTAGIALPADWGTRTNAQQVSWFVTQLGAIRQATGIRIVLDPNDGIWTDVEAALAAAGLRFVSAHL